MTGLLRALPWLGLAVPLVAGWREHLDRPTGWVAADAGLRGRRSARDRRAALALLGFGVAAAVLIGPRGMPLALAYGVGSVLYARESRRAAGGTR